MFYQALDNGFNFAGIFATFFDFFRSFLNCVVDSSLRIVDLGHQRVDAIVFG